MIKKITDFLAHFNEKLTRAIVRWFQWDQGMEYGQLLTIAAAANMIKSQALLTDSITALAEAKAINNKKIAVYEEENKEINKMLARNEKLLAQAKEMVDVQEG